ncbi:hypothetical protein JQ604_26575 [Bradyrhizobium jicamae]|uniref:hypothetical protein n=1 Tax=Bradyrhizobium jicamae TaxID=280332 RepID=UPI001BA6D4E2|nr:hypothetical protein [Bradyrhizobium jicamae]MBR0755753.1 hypothetical protein [Bradyrhizobium jicamae]
MQKLFLISALVLASATAQAGERSLTLGGGENAPAVAPAPANPTGKYVEAPQRPPEATSVVETPKPATDTPRYTARPAPAAAQQPELQQAKVEPTATPSTKPTYRTASHRSARRHHAHTWTRSRIIGELHRHGIYW